MQSRMSCHMKNNRYFYETQSECAFIYSKAKVPNENFQQLSYIYVTSFTLHNLNVANYFN